MDWVRTINNAIDYMETHLTEDVTLSEIAGAVYLSVFHFQRAFLHWFLSRSGRRVRMAAS